MKAALALDACCLPPSPGLPPPSIREESAGDSSFDALLSQAEEPAPAEGKPSATEEDEPDLEKAAEALAALLCFVPPILPELSKLTGAAIAAPGLPPSLEADCSGAETALAQEPEDREATDSDGGGLFEFKGTASEFAASAKEAIALDPKVFRPVSGAEEGESAVLPPEVELADESHGTPPAQQEKSVKTTENTVEIAPGAEQKMPEPTVFRRAVTPVQGLDPAPALNSRSPMESEFRAEADPEVVEVKSVDAVTVVETIRSDVASLRLRGGMEASITLRPEQGPELQIELRVSPDGSVHATAQVAEGDSRTLHSDWPRLQQSLAGLGIQMADLNGNADFQQRSGSNAEAWNANGGASGQNAGSQNSRREGANPFEEQFTKPAAASVLARKTSQLQPAAGASQERGQGWQSWA